MKCNIKIIAALVEAAVVFTMTCCDSKQKISESEEEATYLLVGEPCAEGDYATAIRRADSLLNSPIQMSDTLKAYIMIDRDVSLLEAGYADWGVAYADTVIEFGKRHGIGLAVMQGLQNKGIISRHNGDWDTAIALYKEGLEIAVEENDEEMQQVFAEMLAIACAEHGLNEEAYSFGRKSMDMARQMGDTIQELNSAATLSAILTKEGEYSKAIEELHPYRDRIKNAKNVVRIKCLTPLLKSYLELDSLDKAKEILHDMNAALEGFPKHTQPYYVAINAEAILASKEGRYQDEWRWLQIADSIGTMGTTPDAIYQQRAKCLANLGRYQEAYEMQTKALVAADSLRTSDNDSRLTELMVKYDTLTKENAIANLKTERLGWALVAIMCIVAFACLAIFWIHYRRRNQRRIERERREEYLRGLEQERQRIARELHDDIAGSLLGLQLQLHTSSPPEIESSLADLSKRVRSMSHEMMPPEFSKRSFLDMLRDLVFRANRQNEKNDVVLQREGCFDWNCITHEESHELYRIIQQSLSNAISHGGSGEVKILLSGDDKWRLKIISPLSSGEKEETGDSGVGLKSIRERAGKIGASFTISRENGSFIVTLEKE